MISFSTRAVLVLSLATSSLAMADQTIGEKAKVVKNDAVRATKKGAHRVQEALCAKSDLECLAKKGKHRATEAGDAVGDKVSETKDKISK